jgi:predicted Abi (CAAX) family protease
MAHFTVLMPQITEGITVKMSELPLPQITEKKASNYRMGAVFGIVLFTVYIQMPANFN